MADEDFADKLKREWFAGRAQQIHEELQTDFNRYIQELHAGRVHEILTAGGYRDDEPADVTTIAAANVAATSEGILAAIAMYLSRHETNTQAGD